MQLSKVPPTPFCPPLPHAGGECDPKALKQETKAPAEGFRYRVGAMTVVAMAITLRKFTSSSLQAVPCSYTGGQRFGRLFSQPAVFSGGLHKRTAHLQNDARDVHHGLQFLSFPPLTLP